MTLVNLVNHTNWNIVWIYEVIKDDEHTVNPVKENDHVKHTVKEIKIEGRLVNTINKVFDEKTVLNLKPKILKNKDHLQVIIIEDIFGVDNIR